MIARCNQKVKPLTEALTTASRPDKANYGPLFSKYWYQISILNPKLCYLIA